MEVKRFILNHLIVPYYHHQTTDTYDTLTWYRESIENIRKEKVEEDILYFGLTSIVFQ